jgi:chromosome segregation ATPase
MSDERFAKIDRRFDSVDADFKVLRSDVADLKADVRDLKADVRDLKAGVAELKAEAIDLRRHMGLLHDDAIDRIRGIGEVDSLRREMQAGFAMIMKRFDDHAIPGEAADRAFAATLTDHEKRITALERTSS